MKFFYIDPLSGSDSNDGASEATALRTLGEFNRRVDGTHLRGTTVALRSAQHVGTLAFVGGDPDDRVVVTTYGGDARAEIRSIAEPAIQVYGPGGVTVREVNLTGDGVTGGVNGLEFGALREDHYIARGVHLEGMDITGYGDAGVSVMHPNLSGLTIRQVKSHHCANGMRLGYWDANRGYTLRDLIIQHCEVTDNDWVAGAVPICGYGFALNGVLGGTLENNISRANGRRSMNPGHSGCELFACERVVVQYNLVTDSDDPNSAHGDGSGIIFNECVECDAWGNTVARCVNGIAVFSNWPNDVRGSARCRVHHNALIDNNIGTGLYNDVSRCWITDNRVVSHAGSGGYVKCFDAQYVSGVGNVVAGNRFSAEADNGGTALLAQLESNLAGAIRFEADDWQSSHPLVWADGRTYRSIKEWLEWAPAIPDGGRSLRTAAFAADHVAGRPWKRGK